MKTIIKSRILTGGTISIRIKYIVEMLTWKMANHLLIWRVTKIRRHHASTSVRARTAMEVEHVRAQVITSLTSDHAGCVLLWNTSLGEGRKLYAVCGRHEVGLVETLLSLFG